MKKNILSMVIQIFCFKTKMFLLLIISLIISSNEVYAIRFFQQHNTWYMEIPENPVLWEHSSDYVNDIIINSNWLSANVNWSPTVWQASDDDPIVTVVPFKCAAYGGVYCEPNYFLWQKAGFDKVPLPPEAVPSQNEKGIACWPNYCHDGKMVIISADGKYAWDFGGAYRFPDNYPDSNLRGKLIAKYLKRWDLTGTGVNYPFDGYYGPTFAQVPLLHGLVMYSEYLAGEINHAIAFAYHGPMEAGHWTVYPSNVYTKGTNNRQWAMKGGERLYLDSSVDCNSMNQFSKIVCKALKKYGMIFMENDGIGYNSIYIENTQGKSYSWKGVDLLLQIPLNRLKVVKPICSDCSICPNCVKNTQIDTVPPAPPVIIKID
jgi:hypothetical protein